MTEIKRKLPEFRLGAGQGAVVFPVWRGSVRAEVRFTPLPKKAAARLWHRAREWDRATRAQGRHGGKIGRIGLLVLHSLIFDFLNHRTRQLDPSYEGIAKKAGVSRASVSAGR